MLIPIILECTSKPFHLMQKKELYFITEAGEMGDMSVFNGEQEKEIIEGGKLNTK